MDTQRLVFIIAETKVLFLWGVAMLARLCGCFTPAQTNGSFLALLPMHYAFYPPSDLYNWDDLPSDTRENARETRKKRCPILFPF